MTDAKRMAWALLLVPALVFGAEMPDTQPLLPATTEPDEPAVSDPRPRISVAVPEGFEELLQPQRTAIDVFYGGMPIGTTLVEYTPDEIEFLAPAEVVERIPNVVGRTGLEHHLSGRIARNSDLLCRPGSPAGCGKLQPDFIGVIFDENRFRADVFVHPDMLFLASSGTENYLPMPEGDTMSLVQNLGVTTSASEAGSNHTVNGNTWLARSNDRLHMQWFNTDANAFAWQQLAWERDTRDHEFTAGVFQGHGNGLTFTRSEYLAGFSGGRSLKMRTDLDGLRGTEILLFLDSRSQVDIYRDGKLLSSRLYDPGNQRLDTSRLPGGAYDIEIRIRDITGATRIINRFFINSSRIAPKGTRVWFVEGGAIMQNTGGNSGPESTGDLQLRGALQERFSDELGYNLGGAVTDTHALLEAGGVWVRPLAEVAGQLMTTTQGDYGVMLAGNSRYREWSLGADFRRTWTRRPPAANTDFQLVPDRVSQKSLSINRPAFDGQIGLRASSHRSNDFPNNELYSARYARPVVSERFPPLMLTSDITRSDEGWTFNLGVTLTEIRDHWSGRVQAGYRDEQRDAGPDSSGGVVDARGSWRDGERYEEDIEVGVSARVEPGTTTMGTDLLYASDFGRLDVAVDKIANHVVDDMRVSANFDTSLIAAERKTAIGGRSVSSSGVIIDLSSAPADSAFDVYIDNRRIATMSGGRRQVLMLAPYRTYSLHIVDRGLSFVAYDQGARSVTLLPGTVSNLEWRVEPVVVGVGRIMLHGAAVSELDGVEYNVRLPMRSALISGIHGFAMTDDDGIFQAEITPSTRLIHVRKRSVECDIALEEFSLVNGIANLGDLACIPAEDAEAEGAETESIEAENVEAEAARAAADEPAY